MPKPRTLQSSLPLPFINISPSISQQILTGLPSRSVTTSTASIIVQRMAIVTGKLPNVSSVCYQHSNQRDTVKMCIRSSVSLLGNDLGPSRISHPPHPANAPITTSHPIVYSSFCPLYSCHRDLLLFMELKRPVSGTWHLPFPLPGELYII